MSEEKELIKKKKNTKRTGMPIGLIIGVFFSVFVFILILFFATDPILSNLLKKSVNKTSKGLYSLHFNDLNFRYGTKTIELEGVQLIPDEFIYSELTQDNSIEKALYEVYIPKLKVYRIDVYDLFVKNNLIISEILINEPFLSIVEYPNNDSLKSKSKSVLESDIKSFITKQFGFLEIENIVIKNGNFDLIQEESKEISSSVQGISVEFKQISVDSVVREKDDRFLFSEDVIVKFDNFKWNIDDIHEITINEILISSNDSLIKAKNIDLAPFTRVINKAYTEINVPMLSVNGVDFNKVLMDKVFDVDSLIINKPIVKLFPDKSRSNKDFSKVNDIDIYPFISDKLKGISINDINIIDADLEISNPETKDLLYRVDDLKLFFESFFVDSLSFKAKDKLFHSDNILLNLKSCNLNFLKILHKIDIGNISYSSSNKELIAESVNMKPMEGAKIRTANSFDLIIPKINITGFDIQEVLMNKFPLQKILISDANVQINFVESEGVKEDKFTSEIIENINIDSVIFEKGNFVINETLNGEKRLKTTADIDFYVLDVKSSDNVFLNFKDAELFLNKYELLLPEDNYQLHINKIGVSTAGKKIDMKGLKLKPYLPDELKNDYLRTDISMFVDVSADDLLFENIDIFSLINNDSIDFNKLMLNQTDFKVLKIRKSGKNNFNSLENIFKNLMKNYSGSIVFDKFYINNSGFEMLELSENKFLPISGSDFSLELSGFNYNDNSTLQDERLLFSDNIEIQIDSFNYLLPDKTHEIFADNISISTKTSDIIFNKISLSTIPNTEIKNKLSEYYNITLPSLNFNSFDFLSFYRDNSVKLQSIKVAKPKINFTKNVNFDRKVQGGNNPIMPPIIKEIDISKILIDEAGIILSNRDSLSKNLFYKGELNLQIDDISYYSNNSISNNPITAEELRFVFYDNYLYAADSIHVLKAEKMQVSSMDSTVILSNFTIKADNDSPIEKLLKKNKKNMTVDMEVPDFKINGFNFDKFQVQKSIDIRNIDLKNAVLCLNKYNVLKSKKINKKPEIDFYKSINPSLRSIHIGSIDLGNFTFSAKVAEDNAKLVEINRISGSLSNFLVDSLHQSLENRLFYSDDISLKIEDYRLVTKDSLYTLYGKEIGFSTEASKLYVDTFALIPNFPKYKFSKRVGYQTDRMDITGSRIGIEGLDFAAIVDEDKIIAKKIILDSFRIRSFRNKFLPFPEWQRKELYSGSLRNSPLCLQIDSLIINNSYASYSEHVTGAKKAGEVFFNDVNTKISDITNDAKIIQDGVTMNVNANAKIMNEGLVKINLKMPLDHPRDTFNLIATMSKMKLSSFNDMTENLFGVSIKRGKGRIKKLLINGNKDFSHGELYFPYRRFKIALMNKETGKKGGIGSGIISFLANNILLKSNNRKFFTKLKVGEVYCKRDIRKSMLSYIWKGTLSGIESTLGFKTKQYRLELKEYKKELKAIERKKKKKLRNRK